MSDLERVAHHLEAHGSVSPLDFDGSRPVADGGKPIKRMAARVRELRRERRWRITTEKRDGMAFYVLEGKPAMVSGEDGVVAGRLFEQSFEDVIHGGRSAIFDEGEA